MVKEYIYLDEEGDINFTSRNTPVEFEDQTDCIQLSTETEDDMDRILNLLNLD